MFWRGRSRERSGAAAMRRWHPAFAFAALLAVFLQAFVVQTHFHAPSAPLNLAYEQPADAAHDGSAHVSVTNEHQLLCPICQALAAAGAATLTNQAAALVATQSNAVAVVALSLAPRTISYFWQSRAPPSFL